MSINSFRDLEVWKKSIFLVKNIYLLTKNFPKEEIYALTSQIRRAAVSIPSNIAEGRGLRTTKSFIKHLNIAYGSLAEVETQIFISFELGYITAQQQKEITDQTMEIARMLNGLRKALQKKLPDNVLPLNPKSRILNPKEIDG